MRLERTVIHKVGPFEHFELDLSNVPGPLVAICAPNGTGKTCLLEMSILGACYRTTETQGAPLARAWARDSYVESTFVNGTRQTFRHLLDGIGKKGEAIALGADDVTPLWDDSVSVRTFDAWAKKNLPDPDVVKATTFAAQRSKGFIGLGNADRIQLILEATGVARVERAAAAARKEATRVSNELDSTRLRIADAKGAAEDPAVVEASLAEHREALALGQARATNLRAALADAEKELARVTALQAEADAARGKRSRIEADLGAARERLAGLEKRAGEHDVAAARAEVERLSGILVGAREAFVAIDAAIREREAQRTERDRVEAERQRLLGDKAEKLGAFLSLSEELNAGRELLADAEAIRAAVADVPMLTAEVERAVALYRQGQHDWQENGLAITQAGIRLEALDQRIERASETLKAREEVAAALIGLPQAMLERAGKAEVVDDAASDLERLQGERLGGFEGRVRGLRHGLESVVADAGRSPVSIATAALDLDTEVEKWEAGLPGEIAAAKARLAEANQALSIAHEAKEKLSAAANRAKSMLAAEADHVAATTERAGLVAERDARAATVSKRYDALRILTLRGTWLREALSRAQALAARADALAQAESAQAVRESQAAAARAALEGLEAELAALPAPVPPVEVPDLAAHREPLDILAGALREAELRVATVEATARELDPQVTEARARVAVLGTELDQHPEPAPVPTAPDVALARAEADSIDRVVLGLTTDVARLEQRLDQATAAAARTAELQAKRATLEAELADWARLAIDLGRDGIQSALVDAAGPELTELCNDLLRCHGTRYTVTVETKRAKADGKGETDECRVMVIDTVAGTEKEAREHSGGEQTLLGEAISLALTMLACKRAGVTDVSLVRDESGAALDPDNARAYVAMLRRAAAVVGARRVLIVSHDPLVQELCDHRIDLPRKASA